MDAGAIHEDQLVDGTRHSNLEELTDWAIWANKIISFCRTPMRLLPETRRVLLAF